MRYLVLLIAGVLLAAPAWGAVLGGVATGNSDDTRYVKAFTTADVAGVYSFGTGKPAFPVATLDFELGASFSGVLYACDSTEPDTDGDGDLSDEGACVSLATLSSDTSSTALRAQKLYYAIDINTAGTATLTIKGTWDQISTSGGGGNWDVEVDITSNTCETFNAAIDEYMTGSTAQHVSMRVHHDGTEELNLTVTDDYVAHQDSSDTKYYSCLVMHPMESLGSDGYPSPFGDGSGGTSDARRSALPNGSRISVFFDNVFVNVDQTDLDENAVFLDLGNRWGGGQAIGSLSEGTKLWGNVSVAIVGGGEYDSHPDSDYLFDYRSLPFPGTSNRFSDVYTDSHWTLAAHGATYTNMAELDVYTFNTDPTDGLCYFDEVWGSTLPTCQLYGYGRGVGILYNGVINAEHTLESVRSMDYGVVMGAPVSGGNSVYYTGCANGTCSTNTYGVRGVTVQGGVIEAHRYATFMDVASEARNIFRDIHEETGDNGRTAAKVIKPYFCPSGSNFDAIQWTPEVDTATSGREAVSCLRHYPVHRIVDSAGSGCAVSSDVVNFSSIGVTTSDTFYIFDAEGTGGESPTTTEFGIGAIVAGTGDGTGLISFTGGCGGTFASNDADDYDNGDAYIVILDGGTDYGGTPVEVADEDADGTLVFSGRISGTGSGLGDGSPAIYLGADFTDENTIMFTDGIIVGDGTGTGSWADDMFSWHPELDRNLRSGWDRARFLNREVGMIDTSGAQPNGQMNWPTLYEDWYDSREVSIAYFHQQDESGSAGTGNDTATAASNACVRADELWDSDTTTTCTSTLAKFVTQRPQEYFLTRATWVLDAGAAAAESCAIGLGDGDPPVSGTHFATLQIPSESGLTYAGGEGETYDLSHTVWNNYNANTNYFFIEQYRGAFAPDGTSTPSCTGSLSGPVDIRGFPYDPFK